MKTFSLKAKDIHQKWYVVDAENLVVGRLATIVAKILRAKHDPQMTPHMDHGGYVVLINARKVHLTGDKDKIYYRHTGHPGGIKEAKASELLEGKFPERVMIKAVERMMGKSGPLRRDRMRHLYVYAGSDHPHEAQKPLFLDVKSWSPKNSKREIVA